MTKKAWGASMVVGLVLITGTWWLLLLHGLKGELDADHRLYAAVGADVARDMLKRIKNADSLVDLNHSLFRPTKTYLEVNQMEFLFDIFHTQASKLKDADYLAYGSEAQQYVSVDLVKHRGSATGFLADGKLTKGPLWSFPYEDWKYHTKGPHDAASADAEIESRIRKETGDSAYEPRRRPWYEPATKTSSPEASSFFRDSLR